MAKYGINALVIGERIKQELKKQGKTSVWLAEQLGCHRTNIYKVYERATIDTGLLFHISKLLSFDFSNYTQNYLHILKRGDKIDSYNFPRITCRVRKDKAKVRFSVRQVSLFIVL